MNKAIIENDHLEKLSYLPIYLIFGYLIGINLLICLPDFNLNIFLTNFMASFFIGFSFFKLLDIKGFATSYANYDVLANKFKFYGYLYPFIELGFGLGYILLKESLYLNILVFTIMSISTIGVIKAKLTQKKFYCACVGTFLKVPLGSIAIIEDVTMVIMSLVMIIKLIYSVS